MTISAELSKSLREGDLVQFRLNHWPIADWFTTSLVKLPGGELVVRVPGSAKALPLERTDYVVRDNGGYALYASERTLEVLVKAPPPLYENSDQEKPEVGDVVRAGDGAIWVREAPQWWWCPRIGRGGEPAAPLSLVINGETGR